MNRVYQVNLQSQFGGGEVYTRFFTLALLDLGYQVVLFVSRAADFWETLLPANVERIRVGSQAEIPASPRLISCPPPTRQITTAQSWWRSR